MSQIEEIKGFINQIASSVEDSASELVGDTEPLRATKKVAFINKRMSLVDEDLVPPNLISTLLTHISSANERIVTYVASKDKAVFDQFLSSLNEAISVIATLPVLSNVELDNVRHSFGELTAQKLAELERRALALYTEQDMLIESFQKEWKELIDGSTEKGIAGVKKDLLTEIEKLNEQMDLSFNGSEEKKGWNALAEEKLSEIDGVKERAKQLGVLIADGTTSGGYREQAKAEMWAYRGWRSFTIFVVFVWVCTIFSTSIIAFIQPIVLKIYEIELEIPNALTGIDLIYSRMMSSLPFVAIAAWASSIASNHRKSAVRFKQFEMDLAAFEPSLENVKVEDRTAAKLEFVKTMFGKNHDVVDPTTTDMLKKVLDSVGDLATIFQKK